MNKPYLIQRIRRKTDKNGDTFDGRFSCDYMGSAEFEVGALPASMKRICKGIADFTSVMVKDIKNHKGQRLMVFCHKDMQKDFQAFICEMTASKDEFGFRFKELPYFLDALRSTAVTFRTVDLWWDIDNDAFWCFGKEIMTDVVNGIKANIAKKKAEGKTDWYTEEGKP